LVVAKLTLRVSSPAHGKLLREVADAIAGQPASIVAKPEVLPIVIRYLAARHHASDPLASARLRGIVAQEQLAADTLSAGEVAKLLGISRQAVDKRRKERTLLALERPKRGNRYPAWQFTESGVLEGLETVLDALQGHDTWAQARFMTSGNARLGGKTPILRLEAGDIEAVVRAAELFDEHGAP
jgi:hypothetical protein